MKKRVTRNVARIRKSDESGIDEEMKKACLLPRGYHPP